MKMRPQVDGPIGKTIPRLPLVVLDEARPSSHGGKILARKLKIQEKIT